MASVAAVGFVPLPPQVVHGFLLDPTNHPRFKPPDLYRAWETLPPHTLRFEARTPEGWRRMEARLGETSASRVVEEALDASSTLTWDLEPVEEGTRVTLTSTYPEPDVPFAWARDFFRVQPQVRRAARATLLGLVLALTGRVTSVRNAR